MPVRKKRTQAVIDAEKAKKRRDTGIPTSAKPRRSKQDVHYVMEQNKPLGVRPLPSDKCVGKGLSLRGLIKNSASYALNNAIDVVIDTATKATTKAGKPIYKAVVHTEDPMNSNKVPRPHECFIVADTLTDTNKPINKSQFVIVQCDCDDYMYTYEYANAAHKAAYLIYCNGNFPVHTNPHLQPGLCKHLIALAKHMIDNNI